MYQEQNASNAPNSWNDFNVTPKPQQSGFDLIPKGNRAAGAHDVIKPGGYDEPDRGDGRQATQLLSHGTGAVFPVL
jgi:hypothetical protein